MEEQETLTVKDAGLGDVPHCRRLHDVPDDKLLDGLVLGHAAGTVGAADGLHVPTALLGATVIPPFLGLLNTCQRHTKLIIINVTQCSALKNKMKILKRRDTE